MTQNQDSVFLTKEGDSWFQRNISALNAEVLVDWPLKLLTQNNIQPKTVLEVGCSNGWRLAEIYNATKANCIGAEPSAAAIKDGQKKYPFIQFFQSTAATLPTNIFADTVIVNFVLHWISRENLLQSVANIDRALSDNGYLVIGDFFPKLPQKTPYHHLPNENVFTYKQDYAALFIATGLYTEVSRVVFRHSDHEVVEDLPENERAICVILKKSLNNNYSLANAPSAAK